MINNIKKHTEVNKAPEQTSDVVDWRGEIGTATTRTPETIRHSKIKMKRKNKYKNIFDLRKKKKRKSTEKGRM